MYPRMIDFVPDLPKTVTGKIRRFKVRDAYYCTGRLSEIDYPILFTANFENERLSKLTYIQRVWYFAVGFLCNCTIKGVLDDV